MKQESPAAPRGTTGLTFRDATRLSADELSRLFEMIDQTWFHPHDMTYRGALDIALYRGRDIYVVGGTVAYGLLRGWDAGYAIPSLGIGVRRDMLRRGYGRAMMDELHRLARERRAPQVRLRVHPDNAPARTLYESLGYQDAGEDRGQRVMLLDLRHYDPTRDAPAVQSPVAGGAGLGDGRREDLVGT